MLAVQVQHNPAADEDLQPRPGRQQLGQQRRGLEHLLEVVDHQQELPVAQVRLQLLQGRPVAPLGDVERRGERRGHQRRVAHGGQGDEGRAVGERRLEGARHRQRQARLADAAGPPQGDEPDARALQQLADGGGLALAADQRGQRRRQARRAARPGARLRRRRGPLPGRRRGGQLAPADPLRQRGRLRRGLDAQLLGQRAAAHLVLAQGVDAPAGERQHGHHLPVPVLLPRLQREQPPRVVEGRAVVAALRVAGRQRAQAAQGELVEPLPLDHGPIGEIGRVARREPRQERPPVQVRGRGERPQRRPRRGERRAAERRLEGLDVQPVGTVAAEGDLAAGHVQVVGQELPQVVQRLAQAEVGALVGQVAP